ncbi:MULTISPECIES: undecaprenyl-phosphate glucose phosphotransferase [Spongiibacter]|uniref:undecaprenyl-phosphate glucose phosphotransferase n=1 Tax=Spongiibacter TaxID=630749 RepID=UPI000C47EDE6|nr:MULTISPECIES: undecaprenyl-phosphate glucose phosphotransferase [Spongiibacter]MAY38107.1 undecaprenyl-phosphate glucose phosphotransferase [Spongiibacter sp.]MBI59397.1 undecaprenyl-phosphate glucose phosphotransferase [Spongiibacter sp.]|tara:strand:+ start:66934 stop:68319 length:1386 start_codon:yes stop_codon:yes gene_type:complete
MDKNKPFVSESKIRLALLHRASDIAVIPASAMLAHGLVYGSIKMDNFLALSVAMSMVIALWLYPAIGLYRAWRGESSAKELLNASQAWTFNFLILAFLLYFTENADATRIEYFSVWFFAGLGGILLVRSCVRAVLRRARRRGRNQTHVVIVGDNGLATSTINTIRSAEWAGFNVRGYFGADEIPGETLLGDFHEINSYLEKSADKVDQIWIAMPLSKEKEINQILEELRFATQDVRLIPGMEGFRLINNSVTQVADMPVINLQVSPMTGMNRLVKAVEDRTLAALILLAISPVMIALAIGVKLSSPGPVFYRQERVSRAGKPFMMYKFRSMPVDTEKNGVQWGNAGSKATNKFGQFIRKTSLDELPQFLNVLFGDMSIVGPRPERTQFVNEFKHDIDGYMKKHMVKAGITGWAQVNGWRGDTDLSKRIECDLYYINNWSVGMDIKIIFLTFYKGFISENAK